MEFDLLCCRVQSFRSELFACLLHSTLFVSLLLFDIRRLATFRSRFSLAAVIPRQFVSLSTRVLILVFLHIHHGVRMSHRFGGSFLSDVNYFT